MTLSVVIPTYTLNPELLEMAKRAIKSIRESKQPQIEVIVVEDGGLFSKELLSLSDAYIYYKVNGGFSVNVNRGWRQATGNYVAIMSSDTYLVKGNLLNLCIPGKVTSPHVENQDMTGMAGCFFVAPKSVTKDTGMLNETMHTYFSDEDYKERTKDKFLQVDSVVIHHDQAQTVTPAGVNTAEQSQKDRTAYESR